MEGDASAASYFAALATLHAGQITLSNLGARTRQGDYGFFALCEKLGASVKRQADSTGVVGPRRLDTALKATWTCCRHAGRRAHVDDARSIPGKADTAPTGLATLRVKECDRIAAPTRELRKVGVTVEEGPDWMRIEPLPESRAATPAVVEIETYHDHRIAMSFGVLGSRLPGLRILDPGCVAKTYPNYWRDWQRAAAAPR